MPTGRDVAIKRMDRVFDDEIDCKRILREITLLRLFGTDPNSVGIAKIFDVLEPKDRTEFNSVYVVLDLAESDLKKLLKVNTFLSLVQVKAIMFSLFSSLEYLHSEAVDVIHRDLKPANVLVNEDCTV